jgi:hypothetical protein
MAGKWKFWRDAKHKQRRASSAFFARRCPFLIRPVFSVLLLIRQLNMANKNLGGVFDSRILEVRLDTFGFTLAFA